MTHKVHGRAMGVYMIFLHNVVSSLPPPFLSFNAGTVHPASQLFWHSEHSQKLRSHAQLLF